MIGQGLQFAVYDEGTRLRKKPNSIREILRLLAHAKIQTVVNPLGLGREARRIARERDEAVREFSNRQFDHALVANAEVRGKTIVQDRVVVFGEALKSGAEYKALFDKLVEHFHDCWRQGFCETSFNFTVNHGVTEDGQVVTIDIGEITFDKDVAMKHIREKFWDKAWSLTKDLTDEQRAYATEQLGLRLTPEMLEHLWTEAPTITTHSEATE